MLHDTRVTLDLESTSTPTIAIMSAWSATRSVADGPR